MFEYSPEYKLEPTNTKFNDDEFYYIGFINQDGYVDVLEIMIGELYSESSPYSQRKRYYAKVLIPQEYYKSFIHKWLGLTSTKYYLSENKIDISFIKETPLEAEITFYSILQQPHINFAEIIKKSEEAFAIKYPDIYLNRVLTKQKMTCSHPPFLEGKSMNIINNSASFISYN